MSLVIVVIVFLIKDSVRFFAGFSIYYYSSLLLFKEKTITTITNWERPGVLPSQNYHKTILKPSQCDSFLAQVSCATRTVFQPEPPRISEFAFLSKTITKTITNIAFLNPGRFGLIRHYSTFFNPGRCSLIRHFGHSLNQDNSGISGTLITRQTTFSALLAR